MTNDDEIGVIWVEMAAAWSRADGEKFSQAFAENADFTSVRADHVSGRSQIAAAHGRLFETIYAGTRLVATVRRVRYLAPDIAVVQAESTVILDDGSPAPDAAGNPGNTMHAQAVLERRRGEWKIVSFMNMIPSGSTARSAGSGALN